MVKKKFDKTSEIVNLNNPNIVPGKQNKISEFFLHLMAYGGYNFDKGTMNFWGDPSIFIPIDAFLVLLKNIEDEFGDVLYKDLSYWLGYLYGKNSTLMLIKKFGANKKDINNFINGATQDGMGYLKIKEYDKEKLTYALITGDNSTLALHYKDKYGIQKNPVDYYISGMLAGGTEPLFDIFCEVTEKSCMACGDSQCLYYFKQIDKKKNFNFFKKISIKEEDIYSKTLSMALKRKASFSFLKRKDIHMGDGQFLLQNNLGVNFSVYCFVILNKILLEMAGNEKYLKILDNYSKECIVPIKKDLYKKNVSDILKSLSLFGYGQFDLKFSGSKRLLISIQNNPYPLDYTTLFGWSKQPVDNFLCSLLKNIFLLNSIKVNVTEVKCRAKGDNECLFEINFV